MSDEQPRSKADAYLELLHNRGVEYLFGNAGTDFGPLIDAIARRAQAGEPSPKPVTVTHEVTAMAMAHGYAMVSGKTPAIMVHTVAGTANAIGGLINANRAQVPMLFTAGRTPLTEGDALGARDLHIHWAQESYDQGGMVREWVKWDYELRSGSDLAGVIDRAMAIAESEPKGPVYLTLPREVLAEPHDGSPVDGSPSMRAGKTMAAAVELAAAAEDLIRAS
ncbi:MAG: thiamine pyrophosphate-binding protein, partial [Acidimicrobiales bacterium]